MKSEALSKKTLYVCVLLALTACGANTSEEKNTAESRNEWAKAEAPSAEFDASSASMADTVGSGGSVADPAPANGIPQITPKLIRTADLRFQVKDINVSGENIEKMTAPYKAYISNSSLNSSNSESSNTITIRVPNENFEPLLKDVSKESIFMERRNVSTQDVTEEFVDITARLKTKKEVEARYIDILRTKAKTVKDVLEAEEQIRQIREEIEAREGRLKYLQNQVSYSTITVQLYQQIEYHENPQEITESFGSKAGSGFGRGWEAIQDFLLGLITIWPLLLIGAVVFFLIRKRIRKYRKARGNFN